MHAFPLSCLHLSLSHAFCLACFPNLMYLLKKSLFLLLSFSYKLSFLCTFHPVTLFLLLSCSSIFLGILRFTSLLCALPPPPTHSISSLLMLPLSHGFPLYCMLSLSHMFMFSCACSFLCVVFPLFSFACFPFWGGISPLSPLTCSFPLLHAFSFSLSYAFPLPLVHFLSH